MLLKIFNLPFDSRYAGFSDTEVREFLKDKETLFIRDHFFVKGETPHLTIVVHYKQLLPPPRGASEISHPTESQPEKSWKEILTDADMGLFNLLRDWRSERCKKDGVPPYIVFTNVQLAQIVKSRPQSLAELSKIDGIGKGKLDKYGAEVLSISKIDTGPAPTLFEAEGIPL